MCGGGVIVKWLWLLDEVSAEKVAGTEDAWNSNGDSRGHSISKE